MFIKQNLSNTSLSHYFLCLTDQVNFAVDVIQSDDSLTTQLARIFLIQTNLVWTKSVYTSDVNRNKCELKFNPTSNPGINLIRIKPSKQTKLVRLCDLIQTKSEKFVCVNGASIMICIVIKLCSGRLNAADHG